MPSERCGEAEHETEDETGDRHDYQRDAVEGDHAEKQQAQSDSESEEQPAEEAEDRAAADLLHPGFSSS
jgi:hypothetical protein